MNTGFNELQTGLSNLDVCYLLNIIHVSSLINFKATIKLVINNFNLIVIMKKYFKTKTLYYYLLPPLVGL